MRRNLAFFRLAIVTNLEYRLNYFIDAVVQPVMAAGIELLLWTAIFRVSTSGAIGGFTKEYYLAYVVWAAFVARITSNWMYEFRMIEEIESGSINNLLTRPLSFFEYYLSQFFGYKLATTFISMFVPVAIVMAFDLPTDWSRVGLALLLVCYYLVFIKLISFTVATLSFHLTRVHSLTVAKNLAFWLLSGELIPLDLVPEPFRQWLISLPFCNAVYIPVGYITGRFSVDLVVHGFVTTTVGIVVMALVARTFWLWGLRKYVGTGA